MLSSTCSFVMIDNILGYSFTLLFWEEILIFKTHITNKRETCAALADASHRGGAQECCLLGRCLLTSLPWFGVQDSQAGAFRLATQLCPLCLLQRTSNNAMTAQFRFDNILHSTIWLINHFNNADMFIECLPASQLYWKWCQLKSSLCRSGFYFFLFIFP